MISVLKSTFLKLKGIIISITLFALPLVFLDGRSAKLCYVNRGEGLLNSYEVLQGE